MAAKYVLVPDGEAGQIEKLTGLKGHNTPLGALVEWRDPVVEAIRIGIQMDAIDRALKPRCCYGTFLHAPNCPTWGVMT